MLSKIENGQISPSLGTLQILAKALSLPLSSLFATFEEKRDCSYVARGHGLAIDRRGTKVGHQYELLGHSFASDIVVERGKQLAAQFLEKYICTEDGLKTIDADVAIGVPALKALAEEMSAKNHLIKITYENALNGEVMPNVPQIGKFWGAMGAALQVTTNGKVTP